MTYSFGDNNDPKSILIFKDQIPKVLTNWPITLKSNPSIKQTTELSNNLNPFFVLPVSNSSVYIPEIDDNSNKCADKKVVEKHEVISKIEEIKQPNNNTESGRNIGNKCLEESLYMTKLNDNKQRITMITSISDIQSMAQSITPQKTIPELSLNDEKIYNTNRKLNPCCIQSKEITSLQNCGCKII